MTVTAALDERRTLYRNLSLLELVAEYASRSYTDVKLPEAFPGLSPEAYTFLKTWEGHGEATVWLSVAHSTLDALRRFRNIDAHGKQPVVDRAYLNDLKLASKAAQIALDSFSERMEFLARHRPGVEAS